MLKSKNFKGFDNDTIHFFDWEQIELAPGIYVPDFPTMPAGK